ncbi:hypothetical protein TNCV_2223201 [Trichonephila clavipes]|nr:hypothetical protein TNCV_2223201 [Trichonephila clavipes]
MPPVGCSQIGAREIHHGKGLDARMSLLLALSTIQFVEYRDPLRMKFCRNRLLGTEIDSLQFSRLVTFGFHVPFVELKSAKNDSAGSCPSTGLQGVLKARTLLFLDLDLKFDTRAYFME